MKGRGPVANSPLNEILNRQTDPYTLLTDVADALVKTGADESILNRVNAERRLLRLHRNREIL